MANSEQEFLDWLSGSQSVFDVVGCGADDLPGEVIRLDGPRLDAELKDAFSDKFGPHEVSSALPVVRRISEVITKRIADRESKRLGLNAHGLRNAWFCPIYSELSSFIPLRHLARRLSKKHEGQIFAIPLKSQSLTSLKFWGKNELESFFLASELRRRNARVFLYSSDLTSQDIQIRLSSKWLRKGYPEFKRDTGYKTVLCGTAVRRPDQVVSFAGTALRQRPGFLDILRFLFGPRPAFAFDLEKGPSFGGLRIYSSPKGMPSLEDGFLSLMTPLTEKVSNWYRGKLSPQTVKTCHIADHASFEGGLLAGEVLRAGGKTCLWPHSANVVHVPIHAPEDVSQITVAARSTASHWVREFGEGSVMVDAQAILPTMPPAPAYDETRRLTIILFAGSHLLLRIPLVNYGVHKRSWERSLEALTRADIDLKLKHKSIWETRDWIANNAPKGADLSFTNVGANKLMLPNMVFMSISATSTAIFEGISRGIPGFTIQDAPVDETPYYDPEVIPRIRSDALDAFLSDLNWEAWRDRQMAWFKTETAPFSQK